MNARLRFPSLHLCPGHNHLPKQQPWNTVGRQLIRSDAKLAPAGKADAVQAEFAKAGIPAEAHPEGFRAVQALLELERQGQVATCPAVVAARAEQSAAI